MRAVLLTMAAALVLGCVGQAQTFEDWNHLWRAEVSDRTGTVTSIEVLDRAGHGGPLASDTPRLRNVDPRTLEVAWLGGSCVTVASFSLEPEAYGRTAMRYEIGPPCPQAADGGYALEIRFVHPVDVTTVDAVPDWGP